LHRYGFLGVQKQSFSASSLPELAIDSPDRVSESLYVEAVTPTVRPAEETRDAA